ncbi:hypothetical protein ACFQ60_05085 [Streptomyces zhihengii]
MHLRYGSFTRRHCYDEHGTRPALEDGTGTLVPDERGPVFRVPDWVTPPAFLRPHLDARAAVTVRDMPYEIVKALHFSNGGGVYEAKHRETGRRVVLKEARPGPGSRPTAPTPSPGCTANAPRWNGWRGSPARPRSWTSSRSASTISWRSNSWRAGRSTPSSPEGTR